MTAVVLILSAFFAMNMGGSGMSPAFAAPYGAGAISKKRAAFLFGLFVLLGALIAGGKVVDTISTDIVSQDFISTKVALIVLLSAALSLLVANMLRVAVSTSSVTVFSLISVGLYFRQIYVSTLIRIFSFWLILPVLAYVLSYLLGKLIIPFEQTTLIKKHERYLKIFVVGVGCYVAFSFGSNNVPNAVGPLVGSRIVSENIGFLLTAPFFGLGGLVFAKILNTVGKEITPLGILGAAVNGIIIGSLLLLSSAFGMPQPMIMLDATSIIGIGSADAGHRYILTHRVIRKIISMWIISPLISSVMTYLLLMLIQH
jgi:sulfate permease